MSTSRRTPPPQLEAEIFRKIVADMDDGIIAIDETSTILYCNHSTEILFGYDPGTMAGLPLAQLMPERFRKGHPGHIARFMTGHVSAAYMGSRSAHIVGLKTDGSEILIGASILRMHTSRGSLMVAVVRDITERLAHQDELERLANTDPLTGVYNRRAFLDLVPKELARCQANGAPVSLLLFDIDHFKSVNDRFGHDAGDRVICQFTEIIKAIMQGGDVVARWGGEEFIVFMSGADLDRAVLMAELVRRNTEIVTFAADIMDGDGLRLTTSAGVASSPKGAEDLLDLVKKADQALYAAKSAGRNMVTALKPQWVAPAHFAFAANGR